MKNEVLRQKDHLWMDTSYQIKIAIKPSKTDEFVKSMRSRSPKIRKERSQSARIEKGELP